jgi:8-oxo-dGTP pyrophosphatase MutT (NUDIX family)
MLITTRGTKARWVLPKGNIHAGTLPHLSAAREAREEAGAGGAGSPGGGGRKPNSNRHGPRAARKVGGVVFKLGRNPEKE